jgi:hypothetical protein
MLCVFNFVVFEGLIFFTQSASQRYTVQSSDVNDIARTAMGIGTIILIIFLISMCCCCVCVCIFLNKIKKTVSGLFGNDGHKEQSEMDNMDINNGMTQPAGYVQPPQEQTNYFSNPIQAPYPPTDANPLPYPVNPDNSQPHPYPPTNNDHHQPPPYNPSYPYPT